MRLSLVHNLRITPSPNLSPQGGEEEEHQAVFFMLLSQGGEEEEERAVFFMFLAPARGRG
jgi:hypothetical protein